MKTTFLIVLCFLVSCVEVFAQDTKSSIEKPHQFQVDLSGFSSPILNRNFVGFAMDVKYYVKPKWSTGLHFSATSKKITTDFSIGASEPDITYFSFGWVNQLDLIQQPDIRVGINLNNGLAIVNLRDRSETEIIYDGFGATEVPVSKARNFFYVVEPGISASFRVFKHLDFADVFVTTQAKYRKAFGNPEFATSDGFSGHYLGVGLSLVGLFED